MELLITLNIVKETEFFLVAGYFEGLLATGVNIIALRPSGPGDNYYYYKHRVRKKFRA